MDLARDPLALRVVKHETVAVEFAAQDGLLMSEVGPNHYRAGDALVTGSTGDRWCVSRARFDARYQPLPGVAAGAAGAYRNRTAVVLARQMHEPFSIARSAGGDRLHGGAGDWVVQYAPGDHGVVERTRFARVYRAAD
jgi:hypothetical protein